MAAPLILKLPTADAANKLCSQGGGGRMLFRIDRMANRVAFSRQACDPMHGSSRGCSPMHQRCGPMR